MNDLENYNPYTGRWMQKDPIGFAGGDANLYRYANNNPVNRIDSDGKDSWLVQELGFHQVVAVDDPNNPGKILYFDLAPDDNVSAEDMFFSTLLGQSVPGKVKRRRSLLPGSVEVPGSRIIQDKAADQYLIEKAKVYQEQFKNGSLKYQTYGAGAEGLNCYEFAAEVR